MHIEHKNIVFYCFYMFRRHLQHIQGASCGKYALTGVTNEYFSQGARNEVSK